MAEQVEVNLFGFKIK